MIPMSSTTSINVPNAADLRAAIEAMEADMQAKVEALRAAEVAEHNTDTGKLHKEFTDSLPALKKAVTDGDEEGIRTAARHTAEALGALTALDGATLKARRRDKYLEMGREGLG